MDFGKEVWEAGYDMYVQKCEAGAGVRSEANILAEDSYTSLCCPGTLEGRWFD